ncbi:MAG: hypothetical protein ABSE50_14085 [Xanthobacteraceae bacterium]|jgi:folate-binding Fe-S cluster repair protein YgfZ
MRKTILTILGSALLAVSTVQMAAAAEHHKNWKADQVTARASEQFRDANAYYAWPSARAGSDAWRYEDVEAGPPAGR